jgi:hypothetical protein
MSKTFTRDDIRRLEILLQKACLDSTEVGTKLEKYMSDRIRDALQALHYLFTTIRALECDAMETVKRH